MSTNKEIIKKFKRIVGKKAFLNPYYSEALKFLKIELDQQTRDLIESVPCLEWNKANFIMPEGDMQPAIKIRKWKEEQLNKLTTKL